MTNLPTGRRGRLLALALLVVVLAVAYVGVIGPLIDFYEDRSFALQQDTDRLRRLREAVAEIPVLKAAQEAADGQTTTADLLLDGTTDAVAAASLQTTVKDLLSDCGGTFNSVEILPAQAEDRYRRITIHTSMSADLKLLVDLLKGLETTRPKVFVDNLEIRAPTSDTQDAKTFSVSLDLYGYRS